MKLTLIAPNVSLTEGGTSWVSGQTHDVSDVVGKKLIKARPEIWSTDGKGYDQPMPVQVTAPIEPNKTPEALAVKKKPNLEVEAAARTGTPVAEAPDEDNSEQDEAPDEDNSEPEPHKRGSRRTK